MWRLGSKPTRRPGPRGRPPAGLRLALLSLATVILLLGAVIAGVFWYETIGHGSAHGGSAGAGTRLGQTTLSARATASASWSPDARTPRSAQLPR